MIVPDEGEISSAAPERDCVSPRILPFIWFSTMEIENEVGGIIMR
jgi:hypothetical protein